MKKQWYIGYTRNLEPQLKRIPKPTPDSEPDWISAVGPFKTRKEAEPVLQRMRGWTNQLHVWSRP